MIWLPNIAVMKMNDRIELPLIEPLYGTYHHYGLTTSIVLDNQTIRNWFLSNAINLECNRKFLSGFTTPQIHVINAGNLKSELFEMINYPMQFLRGHVNFVIRNLLDAGYYIYFSGVDDYYVKGKSWYREKHFNHNGMICGYDRKEKTYCIYAYDSNWICQKFWTPQKSFNKGREAMFKDGVYGSLCAIKPRQNMVAFSVETALQGIVNYLDSGIKKYPEDGEGNVRGIVVHEYIAKYVEKLYNGSIPYERMDRRVFRLIWEHKKVMLERIVNIEQSLNLTNGISEKYKRIVSEADTMRMLYASHHMKRRDSVLPIIQKKLLNLMEQERELLTMLVDKAEKELESETLEVS